MHSHETVNNITSQKRIKRQCCDIDGKMPVSQDLESDLDPAHTQLGEGNGNPLQYSCLENPMD